MKRDTLLVVDDSALDLAVLREIFRPLFQVECVENSDAALSYLNQQAQNTCAILLDICLGRRGAGLLLLQRLQMNSETARIPVVLITADAREEYVVSGVNKGAVDFLVKPVDPIIAQERVCAAVRSAWPEGATILDGRPTVEPRPAAPEETAAERITPECVLEQFVRERPGLSMESFRTLGRVTGTLAKALCVTVPGQLQWEQVRCIGRAAVFCDVGLLGLPDEIIAQAESRSDMAASLYWRHTELGAQLFGSTLFRAQPEAVYAEEMARWHHKNYDGTGYPEGPGRDAIPLSGQLVRTALRCMEYFRRFWGYPDWLDRSLRALESDVGSAISPQMYQVALDARNDLSDCMRGLLNS